MTLFSTYRPIWVLLFALSFTTFPIMSPKLHAQQDYWVHLDRPTSRDLKKLSFLDNLTGWAAGDSGTILKTIDGGESWITQTSPLMDDIVDVMMVDTSFGWALAQYYPHDTVSAYGTTLLRTTNGGANWFVQSVFVDDFMHAIEFTDSAHGLLGGNLGKLFWTEDGGVSWTPADIDSAMYARWAIYRIVYYNSQYAMASGGQYDITGLVWRTTDGGRFWTHDRVAGEPVFAIHFADSANVICVGGDLDYGAGMVNTSDGGESWEYTYLGIWGQASAVVFRTPSEGWSPLAFASTYMYTLDSGATWTSVFTPESVAVYDAVFTDSITGYMVGNFGVVLKYVGPPAEVVEIKPAVPDRPFLMHNYPNPFNPVTTFQFTIENSPVLSPRSRPDNSRDGQLTILRVYDLLGREVATIVNEKLAPGTHTRKWDATGFPSGVYFYRLKAGDYVATRKLVLLG